MQVASYFNTSALGCDSLICRPKSIKLKLKYGDLLSNVIKYDVENPRYRHISKFRNKGLKIIIIKGTCDIFSFFYNVFKILKRP